MGLHVLVCFLLFKNISRCKNLTNTCKLTHRNDQNTRKTLALDVERFHILHALSL
jgi:hypothetical protein